MYPYYNHTYTPFNNYGCYPYGGYGGCYGGYPYGGGYGGIYGSCYGGYGGYGIGRRWY